MLLLDTVRGASVRLGNGEHTGLRFATRVNASTHEALAALFATENVTVVSQGTLIAPEDYYLRAGEMSHAALSALDVEAPYLDIAFGGMYFEGEEGVTLGDGDYMVGSIVEIKDYARKFAAVGYMELTVDGVTMIFYSEAVIRSVEEVANAALADGQASWSEEHEAILKRFAGIE